MYIYIYIHIYILFSEYGVVWQLAKNLFFQLVSTMAVFKKIYSHLKNITGYRRLYLTSYVARYVISACLSA